MKEINHTMLAAAYSEWKHAPYGQQTMIAEKWASALSISLQSLYRYFRDMGFCLDQKKEKRTKGTHRIPNLFEYARELAHMYAFLPRGARKPPLHLVIEKALINGLLPADAASIHPSTFARVIREHGLLDEDGRVLRFEAQQPMEQIQYDVSGSEYLYVARIENGEPILKVRGSKAYKNKDRFENLKLWYHGMVDDCSRYWVARPYVSPGESSADALNFFKWAFSKKADPRIILYGLAGRAYIDNGPLARAEVTREFFSRIGVEIKTHEPESPEDTGKIEVKWKQLWTNFEALEFLMDPNWEIREYTLSEIEKRLTNYTVRLNKAKHPTRQGTKEEVWLTIIQNGGVVAIDESAFDTAFKRSKRHVEPDGTFSLDNVTYSVKGLHDAWVFVYQGLTDGQMVAEDVQTHKRYPVSAYEVPGLDQIRTDKAPAGRAIREEAKQYKKAYADKPFKGLYETAPEEKTVTSFPVRAKEERQVENPFDMSVYRSLDEARADFFQTVGTRITGEEWDTIAQMIIENGLNRQFVLDLALEIRGEIENTRKSLEGGG
jgi:hypothetical protein